MDSVFEGGRAMEAKTNRDLRGLGGTIDEHIEKIAGMENGIYAITAEQREILTIIEGMDFLQRHFNKGVRLRGFEGGGRCVEIYDMEDRQQKMDEAIRNFSI
jgi:hypothetical protein